MSDSTHDNRSHADDEPQVADVPAGQPASDFAFDDDATPSQAGEKPSWREALAEHLAHIFQHDRLMSYICAGVLGWAWLTLLGFTLSLSREVVFAGPRSLGFSGGSSGNWVALVLGIGTFLTLIPVVIAWSKLLVITNLAVEFVRRFLLGLHRQEEKTPRSQQDVLSELVTMFVHWFYAFVWSWFLLLGNSAVQMIVGFVMSLMTPDRYYLE